MRSGPPTVTSREWKAFASTVASAKSIAEHYGDFSGEEYDDTVVNDYKYEAHKKIPQQILARTGGKTPLTVLDLGCGTGLLARPFFSQSEAHEVTGVDITPEMTAAAAALPYKRLITGRAQEVLSAELAGERFDVILLVGMLEFIEEPAAFVAMVAAFLEEGGLLGVGAPEKQPFALEKRFGILTHQLPPIEEALRGAGLELEWSGAAHGAMNGYTLDDGATSVGYRGYVWRRK